MKKLLVVLLALTFVFVMASVTLAVVTSSVDGKVEWTFKNTEQFGGSVDGKVVFDLAKDFGEGYSAGLKIKLIPSSSVNVATWKALEPAEAALDPNVLSLVPLTNPAPADVDNDGIIENYYLYKASAEATDSVAYDGDGWIKMVKDFGTLTFQTGGLNGNAANELGVEYDMTGAAGVKFESTSLVDGLSLTVVVNDTFKTAPDPVNDGSYANYLLKGVYTADALTIGAGYQAHTIPVGAVADDSTEKDMMAVWVGYKLSDALSFGLEYASRPNIDGFDGSAVVKGSTAIRAKVDYTAGALTVNGKVQINSGVYVNIKADDIGSTSAWNFFQAGVAGTAIKVDVGYQVTDALKATLTVEDLLDGANVISIDVPDDLLLSYKLDVTDKLSEKASLEGWYASYGELTEIGLKGTYNFVAGLDGTLEVKSVTAGEGIDPVNSYTATLKATL